MKKRIFSIIALALVCVFSLSACDGCFNLPELVFNNAFNGGSGLREEDPQSGYSETLTYDVQYNETAEGIAIDSGLKEDKNLSFVFSEGKYVSTLNVLKSFSDAPIKIESDVVDSLLDNETQAYHLHTEFSIKVNYQIGEKIYDHTDTIVSDSYFCEVSMAFTPVYSKTVADYTTLYYSSINDIVSFQTESEIFYSKNGYKVKFSTLGNSPFSSVTEDEPTITEKEFDYKYKTVIDNAELLFAIRNFNVDFEGTSALPVVAASYGEAKTLAINYKQDNTVTYNENSPLTYNYDDYVGGVEVKHLRFYRNDAKETGMTQHVFIQKQVENSSLPYKALPIKYVEPLTTFASFVPMGTLVYTLKDVEIK